MLRIMLRPLRSFGAPSLESKNVKLNKLGDMGGFAVKIPKIVCFFS